jgi:tRNA pseudouridine55 synthase
MVIPEDGALLLIDKPLTWTSFDVVRKLKYALKAKKIGHAGTLDPLATGLLLIGVGKQTKKLHELQGLDKSYEGTLVLGKTTPSYDLETAFNEEKPYAHLTEEQIRAVIPHFSGAITQFPPAHSAVKIDGERAYKKARRNEEVQIKSREITINELRITRIELPEVDFYVHCSKGTYIRSLAHDIGQYLGVGAHLSALKRTSIGDYQLSKADSLTDFINRLTKE